MMMTSVRVRHVATRQHFLLACDGLRQLRAGLYSRISTSLLEQQTELATAFESLLEREGGTSDDLFDLLLGAATIPPAAPDTDRLKLTTAAHRDIDRHVRNFSVLAWKRRSESDAAYHIKRVGHRQMLQIRPKDQEIQLYTPRWRSRARVSKRASSSAATVHAPDGREPSAQADEDMMEEMEDDSDDDYNVVEDGLAHTADAAPRAQPVL